MAVSQEIEDFNLLFSNLRDKPIIINDLSDTSEENKAEIERLIITKFSSDMLSILPSCHCGKTQGEYAIGSDCPECHSPVVSVIEDAIEPLVWFRKPEGVLGLINPIILLMISTRFKKSGFEIIRWLMDTTYRAPVKTPRSILLLEEQGIQRGYNYFVSNFDYIMSVLFGMKEFSTKNPAEDMLEELLRRDRKLVFSDYIPLPNKSLLIVEKTNVGTYVDMSIASAVDAMFMVVAIDNVLLKHSVRTKENRTAKAIFKLMSYYVNLTKTTMLKKKGTLRKHVFGSRTHFSFRSVASSITAPHEYDSVYAPWGVGISALRIHLINKLLKLGYSYNSAVGLLMQHVENYHPLLDRLLNELIQESPGGKIPVIIQRN